MRMFARKQRLKLDDFCQDRINEVLQFRRQWEADEKPMQMTEEEWRKAFAIYLRPHGVPRVVPAFSGNS